MLRKLLLIGLPIAAPLLVYWIYMLLARRKARLAGQGKLPGWQDAPWTYIVGAICVLLIGGLILFGSTRSYEAGTSLTPPTL